MKRKGETFTEFLTAAVVFGLIAASMFEFMANQTQSLADIRDRDNLIYGAQVICNWNISRDLTGDIKIRNHNILHNVNHTVTAGTESTYDYKNEGTGKDPKFEIANTANDSPITYLEKNIVSFDWDKDTKILTVKNNNTSMTFSLKP